MSFIRKLRQNKTAKVIAALNKVKTCRGVKENVTFWTERKNFRESQRGIVGLARLIYKSLTLEPCTPLGPTAPSLPCKQQLH